MSYKILNSMPDEIYTLIMLGIEVANDECVLGNNEVHKIREFFKQNSEKIDGE